MTRIKILAPLVAIACLSLSVAAYQQAGRGQAQARVVDVDKLRDNLYVLRGGGGNTAIFIAANVFMLTLVGVSRLSLLRIRFLEEASQGLAIHI